MESLTSFNDPGPAWRLLAASTPFKNNDQPSQAVDWVIRVVQALGLEAEQLETVRQDISRRLDRANRGLDGTGESSEVPVRIWVPNLSKASNASPQIELSPKVRVMRHGWGFFLTTRAGQSSAGITYTCVDLFLYNESEAHS